MIIMQHDYARLSDADLRSMLRNCRIVLRTIIDGFSTWPDVHAVILRLMSPEDVLKTVSKLAAKEPELMRTVIRASVLSLTNAQSEEKVRAELRRRMASEN